MKKRQIIEYQRAVLSPRKRTVPANTRFAGVLVAFCCGFIGVGMWYNSSQKFSEAIFGPLGISYALLTAIGLLGIAAAVFQKRDD
jgi:TRAP-type C4-dicarboxylate transport system permease small subunit